MPVEFGHSKEFFHRSSPEVVREIVRLNPDIVDIRLCRHWTSNPKEQDFFLNLSRRQILEGPVLRDLTTPENLPKESSISLVSLVGTKPGQAKDREYTNMQTDFKHIPMVNFSSIMFNGSRRDEEIREIGKFLVNVLGEKRGWILFLARSYQYLGANLLNPEEFVSFMSKCLSENKEKDRKVYVGSKWVAESLCPDGKIHSRFFNRYATLLMAGGPNKPYVPKVKDYFEV